MAEAGSRGGRTHPLIFRQNRGRRRRGACMTTCWPRLSDLAPFLSCTYSIFGVILRVNNTEQIFTLTHLGDVASRMLASYRVPPRRRLLRTARWLALLSPIQGLRRRGGGGSQIGRAAALRDRQSSLLAATLRSKAGRPTWVMNWHQWNVTLKEIS